MVLVCTLNFGDEGRTRLQAWGVSSAHLQDLLRLLKPHKQFMAAGLPVGMQYASGNLVGAVELSAKQDKVLRYCAEPGDEYSCLLTQPSQMWSDARISAVCASSLAGSAPAAIIFARFESMVSESSAPFG